MSIVIICRKRCDRENGVWDVLHGSKILRPFFLYRTLKRKKALKLSSKNLGGLSSPALTRWTRDYDTKILAKSLLSVRSLKINRHPCNLTLRNNNNKNSINI